MMLKLINLLHEALVAEATQFKYQGKTLKMVLIPNTNPTKQGIRIQIIGDFKDLNNSEKDALQVELQGLFNKALGQYNISVNTDPDVRDNDPTKQNVIGLYVTIEQIEGFFRDALRQALPTEDKTKEKAQDGEEKNTDKKEA